MKFLTEREYEDLLKGNKKSEEESFLQEKVKILEKENSDLKKEGEKSLSDLKKDHEIIIKRKDLEVDVKVSQVTKELSSKVSKLEIENGNYKKEVEILTKAFENLGFDVKDMKDILNKLVDGIVSKNTIQLVK